MLTPVIEVVADIHIAERREGPRVDRRKKSRPWYSFHGGRRKGPRRTNEIARACDIDGIARPVAGIALLVMALSLLDAMATLRLLESGCIEANPAMSFLLDRGAQVFLVGKAMLTGTGILFLINYRYHRFFADSLKVGHLLFLITGLYAILNAYQAVLLAIV